MNKVAVYPGTFDPITFGHYDLALRASQLFEKVIFAVADNQSKSPIFSLDERIAIATQVFSGDVCVEVMPFSGLLVDFVKRQNARVIVRGLRAVSDFEFEMQLAATNRQLQPEVETVFLTPAEKYQYLSSTMVREVARLGGDVTQFVPTVVVDELRNKLK